MSRSCRPLASVIVPVFNSSGYLRRCLQSLSVQTLENIEIIAVDDGSTDNSPDILASHSHIDPRFRVITHPQNQGLHLARISGVMAARAEFIAYVDSDDIVAPEMLEAMVSTALTQGADIVRAGADVFSSDAHGSMVEPRFTRRLESPSRVYGSGLDYMNSDFFPAMWLHLHARTLWTLALPQLPAARLLGEDNLTSFLLAFFAKRVVSIPYSGYRYIERPDSLSCDVSLANVIAHIDGRSTITCALDEFVRTNSERGRTCLRRVAADNAALLAKYIEALPAREDRAAAALRFEASWLYRYVVEEHLKNDWS